MATIDPLIVSNNFLEMAYQEKISVTPMKLQKLLFFLYKQYLQNTNRALFADRFETWKYGPVLAEVYHEFSHYRDRSISKYYEDNAGKSFKMSEETDPEFSRALHYVWDKYKRYSGIDLSNLTHKPGTAWRKAWDGHKTFLSDEDILAEDSEGSV